MYRLDSQICIKFVEKTMKKEFHAVVNNVKDKVRTDKKFDTNLTVQVVYVLCVLTVTR